MGILQLPFFGRQQTTRENAETEGVITPRSTVQQGFVKAIGGLFPVEVASELFQFFNRMAVLRYEEAANSGCLLLCRPELARTILNLSFGTPFDLTDTRGVRKMLQISDQQLHVVCDGRRLHGFTTMAPSESAETMVIQFHPHGMWELKQAGRVVIEVQLSDAAAACTGITEERFFASVRQVFGELPCANRQQLWNLISVAQHQLRGTNVLISANARAEAERLTTQGTRVTPAVLTPMLMERLTSIDGTVIIDTGGVCHAIGAILDGPATDRGDRTRGGRFNSALMYVDSSPYPSLIVVISQNGTVDLVCAGRQTENGPL